MSEQLVHFIKTHPQLALCLLAVVVLLGLFIQGRLQRGYREKLIRRDMELRDRIQRDIDAKNK